MNSKDRVRATIEHREPDRVPVFASFVPEIESALQKKYPPGGDVGVPLGNDIVRVTSGIENSFYLKPEGEYVCPFGITWRNVHNRFGHYTEICRHPLAGEKRLLDSYRVPDADRDSVVAGRLASVMQRYGAEKYIVGACASTLFEGAWYLRGLEQFLTDMMTDEGYTNALLDKMMEYPRKICRKFIEMGVDMIWMGDDIAAQHGMLMSPALWRKYLKPRYAKLFAMMKCQKKDIKLCYHSCGNPEAVLPELIEIGLDVLNPIQPLAMDPPTIKKKYGEEVTLFGGFDIQNILPKGSRDEIDAEVRRLIEGCAAGGGFIIAPAHNVQSDTPFENIEAFYEAVEKYGGSDGPGHNGLPDLL